MKSPVVSLGEVCEITSCLVDPREERYQDLPLVGGANIEAEAGKLRDVKTVREEKPQSGKFLFDDSVVLYNKIRPYLVKVARPPFCGLCSADMYPLAPVPTRLMRDYLFYLLMSPEFTSYAIAGSNRAGMPKVNREHLFEFRLALPSLVVQQRIVARINECFERVDEIERLRKGQDVSRSHIVRAARREIFGIPSAIPKGWEQPVLADISDVIYGISAAISANQDPRIGPPIIRMANISIGGDLDLSDLRYCPIPKGKDQHFALRRGDLLLNWRSGSQDHIGKTAIFESDGMFTCASFLLRIRANPQRVNNHFLRHVLNYMRAEGMFIGSSRMQINHKLNAAEFSAFPIRIVPALEEQGSIAERLDDIEDLHRSLNRESVATIRQTKLLRDAILTRAFAGEL